MPDDLPRDLELMAELVAGREEALNALMERWEGPLLGFTHRYLQNRADTEEVVEETFVRVYQRCRDFVPGSNFPAWLFTIAANLSRHRLRWRRRHPSESLDAPASDPGAPGLAAALPAASCDPARSAEQGERIAALRAGVAALPHDQRTAFLLHSYEDQSYRFIAGVLNCSERGVETLLYRARQTLRSRLAPVFAERTPAAPGPILGAARGHT